MLTRRLIPTVVALGLALQFAVPVAVAAPSATTRAAQPTEPCENAASDHKCLPEAPAPIGLPVTGLVVFGGYVWLVRRRDARRIEQAAWRRSGR